ncbi:hypothetical protein CDAR_186161 [Caerostris darwini]|uniref:Uncharacterized protein n=1 Tax=Caerostris darwini TaxID=1538125 RepID=A0AAV4WB77_9ARAC|nr:hypothetical protein CDAR_186161 [Caerostris darwini]
MSNWNIPFDRFGETFTDQYSHETHQLLNCMQEDDAAPAKRYMCCHKYSLPRLVLMGDAMSCFQIKLPSHSLSVIVLLVSILWVSCIRPPTSRAAYYERYCPVSSPPSQTC